MYKKLCAIIIVPIVIFIYFYKWKTNTMYGDDLGIFREQAHASGFWAKLFAPSPDLKFRPVDRLVYLILIYLFGKNLFSYYCINILVQFINTIIFAKILEFFLKNFYFSLLFALIFGLSKFCYYNISQLFNGASLEGLAMTFFLLSLFYIVKTLVHSESTSSEKSKNLYLAILFANLSVYTHERYIVLFVYIILIVLIFPVINYINWKRRWLLALLAIGSIALNFLSKVCFLSIPFWVGTGGSRINFSLSSISLFLADGLESICEINSGVECNIGLAFSSLPYPVIVCVQTLIFAFLLFFILYIVNAIKANRSNDERQRQTFFIYLSLFLLFFLLIVPAVVTIRLEQRWLQASFCIFILINVVAISNINFKSFLVKYLVYVAFPLLFIFVDCNYFYRGADNLYNRHIEQAVIPFVKASEMGIINSQDTSLYILLRKRDPMVEDALHWGLGSGYIFEFYHNKNKHLFFIDSTQERNPKMNIITYP